MTDTTAHQAASRIQGALEAYDAADAGHAAGNAFQFLQMQCSPDSLRALLAERDELAKDAARLDWLEQKWVRATKGDFMNPPVMDCHFTYYLPGKMLAKPPTLRDSIDAARASLTTKD